MAHVYIICCLRCREILLRMSGSHFYSQNGVLVLISIDSAEFQRIGDYLMVLDSHNFNMLIQVHIN